MHVSTKHTPVWPVQVDHVQAVHLQSKQACVDGGCNVGGVQAGGTPPKPCHLPRRTGNLGGYRDTAPEPTCLVCYCMHTLYTGEHLAQWTHDVHRQDAHVCNRCVPVCAAEPVPQDALRSSLCGGALRYGVHLGGVEKGDPSVEGGVEQAMGGAGIGALAKQHRAWFDDGYEGCRGMSSMGTYQRTRPRHLVHQWPVVVVGWHGTRAVLHDAPQWVRNANAAR